MWLCGRNGHGAAPKGYLAVLSIVMMAKVERAEYVSCRADRAKPTPDSTVAMYAMPPEVLYRILRASGLLASLSLHASPLAARPCRAGADERATPFEHAYPGQDAPPCIEWQSRCHEARDGTGLLAYRPAGSFVGPAYLPSVTNNPSRHDPPMPTTGYRTP